ncbi:1,3-beta-glucan synthase [Plasmodiophora brassicae]
MPGHHRRRLMSTVSPGHTFPKLPTLAELLRRRRAGAGAPAPSCTAYRSKSLLPGVPLQIELYRQRVGTRPTRYSRAVHRSTNPLITDIVAQHEPFWTSLVHSPSCWAPLTLLTRICGGTLSPSGYAISALRQPTIFVQGVVVHDTNEFLACPEMISAMLESPLGYTCPVLRVLPYLPHRIDIASPDAAQALTSAVANPDPYVEEEFGLTGPTQGLVFFPDRDHERITPGEFAASAFTATATKHVDHIAFLAGKIGPDAAARVQAFVQANVPGGALEENGRAYPMDRRQTRAVIISMQTRLAAAIDAAKDDVVTRQILEHAVARITADWFLRRCDLADLVA